MVSKLFTLKRLRPVLEKLRRQGKKIVFTNGCFDILHAGHVMYLDQAKRFGDFLVLGLNSDESVRKIKGPERPINILKDRATVLSGLSSVDAVVVFEEETPHQLIVKVRPDVLVKGADWKVEDIAGAKEVLAGGGTIRRIRLLKGRSTTHVIHQLKKR